MIICPSCGGKTFEVYDDCDQAMCIKCQTVLFDFHMLEEADKIVNEYKQLDKTNTSEQAENQFDGIRELR